MKYKDSIRLPELEKIYNNSDDSTDEQLKPIVDEYFSKNEYITINNIQYRFLHYISYNYENIGTISRQYSTNRVLVRLKSINSGNEIEYLIQGIVNHIYLHYENTTI